jgi:dCMP deaminase
MDHWDKRFADVASMVASWSKDPSTKVGCVIVDRQRRIIATGYNGFPRGVSDSTQRLEDRATKYLMVQHAEANALLNSTADTNGATAYVTHYPCANCTGALIQAGIARIVTVEPEAALAERFADSFVAAKTMLNEAGVTVDVVTHSGETNGIK